MSAAIPTAGITPFAPRIRARRGLSVGFMVIALLAITASMLMLGALIVEILVDGAARVFTDGSATVAEVRGATLIDLPTPENMNWLAWAMPVAILLPFLGLRVVRSLIADIPALAERAIGFATTLPVALFVHILYVRFESAYYIEYAKAIGVDGASGNIFQLFAEASGFQFVRLIVAGLILPLGILAAGWFWSNRLRRPSLLLPGIAVDVTSVFDAARDSGAT